MGEPVALGHACGRCGEQIHLSIHTDGGTYTHDLAALLRASGDDRVLVRAECGCPTPREAAFEATALPTDALQGSD